jgi:hypothetical protein
VADFPWSADEVDDNTPNVARMDDWQSGALPGVENPEERPTRSGIGQAR